MQTPRFAPVTLLLLGALAFAGCDEVVPNQPQTPDGGAVQDAEGRPLTFPQLSSQDEAQYADMVVGADGTLHAIYQDKSKQHDRPQVYHRASTDGGATWSEEVNLLEDDLTSQAGFVRAAVDGAGRVYALWKTYKGFDSVDASGGNAGTVAYRALENGQWGPITTVGPIDQVMGWFPDTAPDGTLHLVWSETLPREGGSFTPDWQAGRIKQATLSGAAVGEARVVFEAPPQRVGDSPVVNYDGYRGLQGYVDAAGTAHFVALKTVTRPEVGAPSDLVDVVHFDGARETPLLKVATLEAVGAAPIRWSPPVLLQDAAGQEHLVVLDQGRAPAAVLAYAPPSAEAPKVIYQPQDAKGEIRGMRAYQGPEGRIAAIVSAKDGVDHHDALVARFDGTQWGQPINVTNNQAREAFWTKNTDVDTDFSELKVYSAQMGAGAFDPAGRLNLLLVNKEIVTVMGNNVGLSGSGFVGSNSTSHVYFHRL